VHGTSTLTLGIIRTTFVAESDKMMMMMEEGGKGGERGGGL